MIRKSIPRAHLNVAFSRAQRAQSAGPKSVRVVGSESDVPRPIFRKGLPAAKKSIRAEVGRVERRELLLMELISQWCRDFESKSAPRINNCSHFSFLSKLLLSSL